ncbi:MAG: hypothetical protein NTY02_18605 [Acidobacteria bacterium]|nr:hypothetical protein [Acidobacteriota bacterium]
MLALIVAIRFRIRRRSVSNPATKPGEFDPAADESRQQVLQLGEFHLPLAFARAGPAREDVQDELRAVDHPTPERLLCLPQLAGAQLVIEDDEVNGLFVAGQRALFELAPAHVGRWIRLGPLLQRPEANDTAGSRHEARQFVE